MFELLITTITLFTVFANLFSIPCIAHKLRFFMNLIQFILNIFLLFKIFYKKHSLWNEPDIQPIHQLPFFPLSNISYIKNNNSNYSLSSKNIIDNFHFIKSGKLFSISFSKHFSKECFPYYYVNDLAECPISDIIEENNQTNKYQDYSEVKIENKYLYFTKNYEAGKLYTVKNINELNVNDIISNFKVELDYMDIENIGKKEKNKISNPIKPLKYY